MAVPKIIGLKKRFHEPVLYDAHGAKLKPDANILYDANNKPIIRNIVLPEKFDLRRELLQNIPKSHTDLRPQEIKQLNKMKIRISSLGNDMEKARNVLLALPEFKEAVKRPGAIKYIDGMGVDELIGFCDKLFEMRIERRRQHWFDEIERLARHKAKQ